ncbi:hypothetical protein MLD38_010896 [Melastoma candidum]|uniref:Uncharacterized protein n=1 Tax=Melastoma candidum TaxID=119954 RepID=A0ACB9R9N1_9MYRT|nr:hypothetical protein MLD38_010896 [Melastoma candidum]
MNPSSPPCPNSSPTSDPLVYLSQLQLPGFDPDPIQFPGMSQCVHNWDLLDDTLNSTQPHLSFQGVDAAVENPTLPGPGPGPGPNLSQTNSRVAELTWDNGQLFLHGHGSRLNSKPDAPDGTLESLVDQATSIVNAIIPAADGKPSLGCPWFDPSQAPVDSVATASATTTMTMDMLVPFVAAVIDNPHRQAAWLLGESVSHDTGVYGSCSHRVGSCSAIGGPNGGINPVGEEQRQDSRRQTCCGSVEWGNYQSASGSATYGYNVRTQDMHGSEPQLENAASHGAPEDMNRGEGGGGGRATAAATTEEEQDSVYSGPQREAEEKRRLGRSSTSTKCSRAAAIHNQSERKRRDKINQRMKTLQQLVPNSRKTDKASVLDEVIDYLKQLQAQVQMMSRMNVPISPMMLPPAMQQQLQLSMMGPMGLGLGLAGMPRDMDMPGLDGNRPNMPGVPPVLPPFMPTAPWNGTPRDRFLASQSSPAMTLDTYSRLAAMYQHHMRQRQQPPPPPRPSNPNN